MTEMLLVMGTKCKIKDEANDSCTAHLPLVFPSLALSSYKRISKKSTVMRSDPAWTPQAGGASSRRYMDQCKAKGQVSAFGAPSNEFTEQSDNVWYLKRSPPARKAASSRRTARPGLCRPNTSNPMDPSSKSRYVNECSPSPTPTQDQIVVQEYNNQRFHYQSEVS